MTNEQILKKAIEKIIKNGWKGYWEGMPEAGLPCEAHSMESEETCVYKIIFSHDFAKAFVKYIITDTYLILQLFGDSDEIQKFQKAGILEDIAKEKFLQQMVLEENPLSYIEKYL